MVNLVALVLILTSSTTPQQPVPVNDPPHVSQTQNAPTARPLTPEQRAWFAHAVDHILTGE
jgi:hypothetical protein